MRGLSTAMENLLTWQGQQQARNSLDQLMFACARGLFVTPPTKELCRESAVYQPSLFVASKSQDKDVGIVTNYAPGRWGPSEFDC